MYAEEAIERNGHSSYEDSLANAATDMLKVDP